jgi:Protein of unknown function (DUF3592)
MDRVILVLLVRGLVLLLRPFTATWHALQDRFRRIGTADWPTATGVIFTCHIGNTERVWVAEVTYSYSAAGEYWSGQIHRHFALEKDAEKYAESHPNGSSVMVRYDPNKPEKSVVLADDQRMVSAAGSI